MDACHIRFGLYLNKIIRLDSVKLITDVVLSPHLLCHLHWSRINAVSVINTG